MRTALHGAAARDGVAGSAHPGGADPLHQSPRQVAQRARIAAAFGQAGPLTTLEPAGRPAVLQAMFHGGEEADDDGGDGHAYASDHEQESDAEDDDGFATTREPYLVQGLELLADNANGLPQFLADVMQRPIETFPNNSAIVTGVLAGVQRWAQASDIDRFSGYGQVNISDPEGQLARKQGGTWAILPARGADVREAFSGAIWSAIRQTLQSDAAGTMAAAELLTSELHMRGVTLRFTSRVSPQQQQGVLRRTAQFYNEIAGANCAQLSEQVFRSQRQLKAQALNAWDQTTGANAPANEMVEAKRQLFGRTLGRARLRGYLEAAQGALLDVLQSDRLMLVIDAAETRKAYGGATANNTTNAQHVVAHDVLAQINAQEMVRINLDATGLGGLKVTLAHEVAHIAGFNPQGMADSGHMASALDYVGNEEGTGLPKLLFDAYFFETVYQRFMSAD